MNYEGIQNPARQAPGDVLRNHGMRRKSVEWIWLDRQFDRSILVCSSKFLKFPDVDLAN